MEEQEIIKRSELGDGYTLRYSEPNFNAKKVLVDNFNESDEFIKRRRADKAMRDKISKSKEAFGKNILTKTQKWKAYFDVYNAPLYMWAYKKVPAKSVMDEMEFEKEFLVEDFEFTAKKADKFSHRLRAYFESHPLISKVMVARTIGVSRSYINALLDGRMIPSAHIREDIINLLKHYGL